jgi:hypothetical protein
MGQNLSGKAVGAERLDGSYFTTLFSFVKGRLVSYRISWQAWL